jgi:hypothetical protein
LKYGNCSFHSGTELLRNFSVYVANSWKDILFLILLVVIAIAFLVSTSYLFMLWENMFEKNASVINFACI